MSRQSDAKSAQGYEANPPARTCGNCKRYQFDMALPEWMAAQNAGSPGKWGDRYMKEKNKRCAIGGFAVKKMATCNQFVSKPPAA